ncbi:MAG: LPS assembly protein LptD [Candidatus Omnitrophica bacterium]|nr:LPS assembly protein LptD [Candidatus Omnitrophota bacterium]
MIINRSSNLKFKIKVIPSVVSVLSVFILGNLCLAQEKPAEEQKPIVEVAADNVEQIATPLAVQENAIDIPSKGVNIEPITLNGDRVEYLTDSREVVITGNVEVVYKGAKLTCQKLTLNTQTKEGQAEGKARLEDKKGEIEGEKISYNFENKTGIILDAAFRANPYFGKSESVVKVDDNEFISHRGYMTTCNFDQPHWKMKTRKVDFFMKDRVQMKDASFFIGPVPLLYLPQFSKSFHDPFMHVQVTPGSSKDWGKFVTSAWRYNLNENLDGQIFFDVRQKMGIAEGFGANYKTPWVGKGDFKFYYTHETPSGLPDGSPNKFNRYFGRWRHKWDIDDNTNAMFEFYKTVDQKRKMLGQDFNVLKDYFRNEYDIDSQPPSYASMHHNFSNSSLDIILQNRTNSWYTSSYLEKIPEARFSLPSVKLGSTRFYFGNDTTAANLNLKNPGNPDTHVNRIDTTNKFSFPMKVSIFSFTPFVGSRQTFYDNDVYGQAVIRNMLITGSDISTKFYRVFNIKTNFIGLDINSLRHVITPTIGYSYNHQPTIVNSRIRQLDGVDSITQTNQASLGLTNKLQTKRNGQSVDLVNFLVSTPYIIKPKTGDKLGSNFSDIDFDLDLIPYSWLRVSADAKYKHSGNRSDSGYGRFANVNLDVNFNFGTDRGFGISQHYERKGQNWITYNFDWRANPKWKVSLFQTRERGHKPGIKRGMREQQYTITRDLHCWEADFTFNSRYNHGNTFWLIFRLKAFPEMEFEFNKSYSTPTPGTQNIPK